MSISDRVLRPLGKTAKFNSRNAILRRVRRPTEIARPQGERLAKRNAEFRSVHRGKCLNAICILCELKEKTCVARRSKLPLTTHHSKFNLLRAAIHAGPGKRVVAVIYRPASPCRTLRDFGKRHPPVRLEARFMRQRPLRRVRKTHNCRNCYFAAVSLGRSCQACGWRCPPRFGCLQSGKTKFDPIGHSTDGVYDNSSHRTFGDITSELRNSDWVA